MRRAAARGPPWVASLVRSRRLIGPRVVELRTTGGTMSLGFLTIVATGAGPVIAAAWVSAATGSFIPIVVMLVFFTLCALIAAIWMPEVAGRDLTDPRDAI